MAFTTVLYAVWFLLPVAFLLLALWAFLERLSGKPQRQDAMAFIRQAGFVLSCVLACLAIDHFVLAWVVENVLMGAVPLALLQVILLPFILLLGAKLIGPTKDIQIARAPQVTSKSPKTKPRRGAKS